MLVRIICAGEYGMCWSVWYTGEYGILVSMVWAGEYGMCCDDE